MTIASTTSKKAHPAKTGNAKTSAKTSAKTTTAKGKRRELNIQTEPHEVPLPSGPIASNSPSALDSPIHVTAHGRQLPTRRASITAPVGAGGGADPEPWKAVGNRTPSPPSRNNTLPTLQPGTSMAAPPPPGLGGVMFDVTSASLYGTTPPQQQQLADVPIFEFYGGRAHGQRSFSLSLAPTEDAMSSPAGGVLQVEGNPSALLGAGGRRFSHQPLHAASRLAQVSSLLTPVQEGSPMAFAPSRPRPRHHQATAMSSTHSANMPPSPRTRSKSSSHIFRDPHGNGTTLPSHAHVQGFATWRRPSTQLAPPSPGKEESWREVRRFSSSVSTLPQQSQLPRPPVAGMDELAAGYFRGDLQERRRHSVAAAMVQATGGYAPQQRVDPEFSEQYGSMISNASVVSPLDSHHRRARRLSETSLGPGEMPPYHHQLQEQQPSAVSVLEGAMADMSLSRMDPNKPRTGLDSLYVVEFRAGRTDFFYLPEDSLIEVDVGDLVMVEADRGQDLGKVLQCQVFPQEAASQSNNNTTAATIRPKLIYGHARPEEVAQLLDKSRDESKCLAVVQAKIRQKQLPLEVVDAEYQWDRNKLTLYYVAENRVDFRELVKDLFKIYKTRIWMCAVDRR